MSYYKYNIENLRLAWKFETAFRTNAHGYDTSNEAGDVFYPLPIKLTEFPHFPYFHTSQKMNEHYPGGGPDFGFQTKMGFPPQKIQLVGQLIHFPFLKALCTAQTTTENTPSSGYHTHVYATSTARATTTPSFQLYFQMINDAASENLIRLCIGCVIENVVINAQQNMPITVTIDIICARIIAGTLLTSVPTLYNSRIYNTMDSTFTFSKGGTSYHFTALGFIFNYNDGKRQLNRTNTYCVEVDKGPRQIAIDFFYQPKELIGLTDFIDQELLTASDIDLTIKIARDSSTDYIQFTFEKLWSIQMNPYIDYYANVHNKFVLKNTLFESGAKLTITEVNSIVESGVYS